MPEGLSSSDVAGEISRHKTHSAEHAQDGEDSEPDGEARSHDRTLSVIEAVMLAIVALLAAYTGYASAKWNTESSVRLAQASADADPGEPRRAGRAEPAQLRLDDIQYLVHRLRRR